ncbi:MAG: IgG-binding virulence factor TspB family protein [Burkholderiaceae bacterium]|nr:IgG-binding virulence factor TspB family protein [Burkholderiaceae bacterium]
MTPFLFVALLLASTGAFAQSQGSTRFGSVPREVFRPIPGGYEMRQGGFTPNLTNVPQPLSMAQGIKGRGAFTGGKHFRIDGTGGMKSYDMGGIFDMPVPGTKQTAPVQVITKNIPKKNVAKAVFNALPVIGTAVAVLEIAHILATEWDSRDPEGFQQDGPAVVDPVDKSITRMKTESYWDYAGQRYSSPSAACASVSDYQGTSIGAIAVYVASHLYDCQIPSGSVGQTVKVEPPPVKRPIPADILDEIADDMPENLEPLVDDAFEQGHNKPGFAIDIPNDLPKESSGPATTSPKTETVNKPDGSKVETTTTTDFTYQGDKVKIDQRKKTVYIDPNGLETPGDDITVTGETPDPVASDPTSPGTEDAPADPSVPDPNQDPNKEPTEIDLDICKLNPDILACKKLDSPEEGEIPKEDRDITLQTGPTFGGGACIPNVTVQVFGTTITALNFTEPCRWLSDYLKPLLLLMASISAVFIVLPRES